MRQMVETSKHSGGGIASPNISPHFAILRLRHDLFRIVSKLHLQEMVVFPAQLFSLDRVVEHTFSLCPYSIFSGERPRSSDQCRALNAALSHLPSFQSSPGLKAPEALARILSKAHSECFRLETGLLAA